MKLAQVQVKVFSETSAIDLETAVNVFLKDSKERTFVSVELMVDGSTFAALVTYTN